MSNEENVNRFLKETKDSIEKRGFYQNQFEFFESDWFWMLFSELERQGYDVELLDDSECYEIYVTKF